MMMSARCVLDFHHSLGREHVPGTVDVRLELDPVVADLADIF